MNIPSTDSTTITYNGVVFHPITLWNTSTPSETYEYAWLGASVRILMGEDSTDGAYHLIAQFAFNVLSTRSYSRNVYRMIGSAVTGSTPTASYSSGDIWTDTEHAARLYNYSINRETGVAEVDNPYMIADMGTFANGVDVESTPFYCAFFPSGVVNVSITGTWSVPSTKSVSFGTGASGSGTIAQIAAMTLYPQMSWNSTSSSTDSVYTLTLPSATSTESAFTFIGWTVNGTDYNAGDTVEYSNATAITATPRFTANSISFTYSVNGETTAVSDATVGTEIPFTAPAGYVLAGWSVSHNAGWYQSVSSLQSTLTPQSSWSGKTVYAVWAFAFTFEDSLGEQDYDGYTLYAEGKLASNLPAQPYHAGFVFAGWKNGDTTYSAGAVFPASSLASSNDFLAVWYEAAWRLGLVFIKTAGSSTAAVAQPATMETD